VLPPPINPPIPACPVTAPSYGLPCIGSLVCNYPDGPCSFPRKATCIGNAWVVEVGVSNISCNPPRPSTGGAPASGGAAGSGGTAASGGVLGYGGALVDAGGPSVDGGARPFAR
jgi:hypothetical protein